MASIDAAHQWVERKRVLQLLEGLDPCFNGRKATLLHQSSLPTIDEVVAAMAQEEVRLSLVQDEGRNVPAPAFTVAQRREWREYRECFHYGEQGHVKQYCPAWRNRGRGGYSRGRGQGQDC